MKTPKIGKKELMAVAPTINAVEFEELCEKNGIHPMWLDVTITNYNEEYYNVEVSEYGLEFIYYNGKLDEIIEL